MTFNDHVNAALELAEQARTEALEAGKPYAKTPPDRGAEARDLSIAVTHLEDALTRYNSSRYRRRGTWGRADPDLAG